MSRLQGGCLNQDLRDFRIIRIRVGIGRSLLQGRDMLEGRDREIPPTGERRGTSKSTLIFLTNSQPQYKLY